MRSLADHGAGASSYGFGTEACKKRLQFSIHHMHSVKNETVMQAGTQSKRGGVDGESWRLTQAMGRERLGCGLRVSIALGENFFFSAINSAIISILPVSLIP